MKASIIITFCLFSFNLIAQKLEKLEAVEKDNIAIAENFANSYFELVKKDQYYVFKEGEAIDPVKNTLTESLQKNVYKQLSSQFGEFTSLEYAESWTMAGTSFKIHRFKPEFDDSVKKLEVRVVLDAEDKIAGFFTIPWSDVMK